MGRGRSRPLRNLLTRMDEVTHGPMSVLRNCMINKTRVKVLLLEYDLLLSFLPTSMWVALSMIGSFPLVSYYSSVLLLPKLLLALLQVDLRQWDSESMNWFLSGVFSIYFPQVMDWLEVEDQDMARIEPEVTSCHCTKKSSFLVVKEMKLNCISHDIESSWHNLRTKKINF